MPVRGLSRIRGVLVAAAVIAVALVLVTPALAAENPDGVAVIIGNQDYLGGLPKVEFARNDAAAMKTFVVERLGFRIGNIIDLSDATQAEMEAAFGNERTHQGKLWRWLRPGKSDVVVFYSGHGVPGRDGQRGYLLPVNADPDAPEINGYPIDLLLANLAKLEARSVTVYLDACFSGESAGGTLSKTKGLNVSPRLPQATSGITVLTAASGSQVAFWDTESKHGLFTRYLLDALYGAADGEGYRRRSRLANTR